MTAHDDGRQLLETGWPREGALAFARDLIAEIRRSTDTVAAYLHPVGFIQTTVAATQAGTVRLHIWPSSPVQVEDSLSSTHDHVFDFLSYVVVGELLDQRVRLFEDQLSRTHQVWSVQYGEDGVNSLIPTGRWVTVEYGPVRRFSQGSMYEVAAGEFHRGLPPARLPTATLMITRLAEPNQTPLALGGAGSEPLVTRRDRCSSQAYATALDEVLEAL